MNYYNSIEVADIKYSVDMIRFKFDLSDYLQNQLYILVRSIQTYDYFNSQRSFQYRDLYKIFTSDRTNSFSLGVSFNGVKKSDRHICFIEFNPNKLYESQELYKILKFLLYNKVYLELVLYDIAIDIPYNKKFISLIKDKRIYKKFCYDCVGENVTEYLGTTAEAGRVKLYNKKIESELDYDLTRLELTTSFTDFLLVQKQLPKLCVCGDLDLLIQTKLSKSDYVLLQLLWLCDDPSYYFKQLGRDKQEKLKPFVSSNFNLGFSESVFNKLIRTIDEFRNCNYYEKSKENL